MTAPSPAEWSDFVDRFEQSSLTQPAFAQRYGLSLSCFRYHLYRLRRLRGSATDLLPRPLPVRAEPSSLSFLTVALPGAPLDPAPALAIELGARLRLRFERLPEPGVLADLVAALVERLPC